MITELLRKQIRSCGKSLNQISRENGVNKAVLSRIMHGGGCKDDTADTLLKYFGFEIVKKHKQKRQAKK